MGFTKEIESKKAVTMNHWRIVSLSLNRSGNLNIRVAGYRDGEAFSKGAEPIDEYEVVFTNAAGYIKAPFYDMVEQCVDIFKGAEKELSYSAENQEKQIVTVQSPQGDLLWQKTINHDIPETQPEAAPEARTG